MPRVDSKRIAMVGHSFGGQLTLLAADRGKTVRAAITFAAAADSWGRTPELREQLLAAVPQATVPIMLIQADNDYSTAAGRALSAELDRMHKPHLLEIYRAVGQHRMMGTTPCTWPSRSGNPTSSSFWTSTSARSDKCRKQGLSASISI